MRLPRLISSTLFLTLCWLLVAQNGVAETYEYDGLDRLTRVTYDDGSFVAFAYDLSGNVLSQTVPEPGAGSMLFAGILMMAGLSARRSRRASAAHASSLGGRRAQRVLSLLAILLVWMPAPGEAWAQAASASNASGNWQEEAFSRIRRAEYEVSFASSRGGRGEAWQAPNRAQGFRTRFLDGKIEVVPRDSEDESWEIGLAPEGYGRGSAIEALGKTTPRFEGARVRYPRGGVVEWFVNEPKGLKQGFTLQTPPGSTRRNRTGRGQGPSSSAGGAGDPAFVSLRVDGDVRPVLAADRQSVSFESNAALLAVAHYSELVVLDARGTRLDSWMEVRSEGGAHSIRLAFDDREAVYPVEIDPVLTTPAWSVSGNQPEAGLGFSVAGAGDVNADGFDDVLVAAPFYDHAGIVDSGRVYLFLGSPSGLSPLAVWVRNSPDATGSDLFGYALAGGEDVNGDGYDDFLVSELNPFTAPPNPNTNGAGVVYLFLGSPVGPSATPAWQITGRPGKRLGFSVALIGADDRDPTPVASANGDALADVVIGEPGSWNTNNDGRVYVFYGAAEEPNGQVRLGGGAACSANPVQGGGAICDGSPAVDATIWGQAGSADYFGERVASAGDVNCDGNMDLVVGQPHYDNSHGRIQVFLGCDPSEGIGCAVSPPGVDPAFANAWALGGADSRIGSFDNFFGDSVASARTVDGDEDCDVLLVGASGRDTGGNTTPFDVGAVFKVYAILDGSDNPIPDVSGPFPTPLHLSAPLIEGSISGERLGSSVAVLGDVNGDSELDFLFGAPGGITQQVEGSDLGRVYMKTGPPIGDTRYPDVALSLGSRPVDWRITGTEPGDHLGSAIAGVGDVDGDSLDDFIVGSSSGLKFLFDPNFSQDIIPNKPGEVRLYNGRQSDLVGSLLGIAITAFSDAWAYIARGSSFDTQLLDIAPNSPAVAAGPAPNSLLITSGLAQDEATGATDWGDDGAPDIAGAGLTLIVPPSVGVQSLRLTTQYLTADPNPTAPPTSATIRVNDERMVLETPIAEAGRGARHAPLSHGIAIAPEQTEVKLSFEIEETTAGAADAGLLVSRLFFSELPLPNHVTGNYIPNPSSTDLSKSRGSFSYRLALVEVPGGQLPLQLVLTYSSEDDRDGPVGSGWRHSLQATVTEDQDYQSFEGVPPVAVPGNGCPDSIYVEIGARTEVFDEPDGETETTCHLISYAPRYPGVFSTLDLQEDGAYVHETKEGRTSTFEPIPDQDGTFRRVEVSNEWGESIVFDYDAAAPSLPVSIFDSVGENFLLTYDVASFESPRLTGFFGSTYEIEFGYDALGTLASVIDVNGLMTTIETDSQGRVFSIVDADGARIVGNDYESFAGAGFDQSGKRLVRQRNSDPADVGVVYGYDDEYFEIVSREGGRVRERYDPFGRLADRRVLIDESRFDDLDSCEHPVDPIYVPVDPADPPAPDKPWCALTAYQYDADGNTIQVTDPRGYVRRMKYDDRGNRICITEDADGPNATPPRMPTRTRFIFDSFDNVVEHLTQKDRSDLPGDCSDDPPYDVVAPEDLNKWNTTRYTYDAVTGTGPLSITEVVEGGDDRITGLQYSGSLLATSTDPQGRISTFEHDALSNLRSLSDPLGNVTLFAHDALGQQTTRVGAEAAFFEDGAELPGPESATFVQSWDAGGRLLSTVDAMLETTVFTYDARGRELTRVDEAGQTWTRSYTPTGKLATVTNPLDDQLQFAYDSEDRLVSRTDARDSVYTSSYDARGMKTETVDPMGGTESFEYDWSGNLVAVTDARRLFKSKMEYDAQGRLSAYSDQRGIRTVITRDAQGRILTQSRPGPSGSDAIWSQTYTTTGEVATSTDPEGISTEFTYSPTGRLTSSSRVEAGQATVIDYDALDRVTGVRVAGTGSTPAAPVISVIDFESADPGSTIPPDYTEKSFTFSHLTGGDDQAIVDNAGNNVLTDSVLAGFSGAGSRLESLPGETFDLISLDIANLTAIFPGSFGISIIPNGEVAQEIVLVPSGANFETIEFDGIEQPSLIGLTELWIGIGSYGGANLAVDNITLRGASATSAAATYAYDAAGHLTTIIDPNGNATEYAYDRMSRVTRERDAMLNEVLSDYDARGQLQTRTNARGQVIQFEADDANRQTGMSAVDSTGSWSIQRVLDPNGNIESSIGSNSTDALLAPASIATEYDLLDRPDERTVTLAPGLERTVGVEYDASGNVTALIYDMTAPASSRVEYAYDAVDRLIEVSDGSLITTYGYDDADNLTDITRPDGSQTSYVYDDAGRLLSMSDTTSGETLFSALYALDPAGRRISAQINRSGALATAAGPNESFTYDAANHMATRSSGGAAIVHDPDGNLQSATIGGVARTLDYNALNQLVELDGESIRYDANGLRASRTVGGVTTYYLYDPFGRLLEEVDDSGATIARYVHGMGLVTRAAGSAVSVYHFDSRGSTVALTDPEGTVTDSYAYTPYGAISARTGGTSNPFTYSGRDGVFDDGNGLFYTPARYYAPELMRFVQKDPVYLGDLNRPSTLNRYAFVLGNPIELVDPDGDRAGWAKKFLKKVGNEAGEYAAGEVGDGFTEEQVGKLCDYAGPVCDPFERLYDIEQQYQEVLASLYEEYFEAIDFLEGLAFETVAAPLLAPVCSELGGVCGTIGDAVDSLREAARDFFLDGVRDGFSGYVAGEIDAGASGRIARDWALDQVGLGGLAPLFNPGGGLNFLSDQLFGFEVVPDFTSVEDITDFADDVFSGLEDAGSAIGGGLSDGYSATIDFIGL